MPSKFRCQCILEERDKYVKAQWEAFQFPAVSEASVKDHEQSVGTVSQI